MVSYHHIMASDHDSMASDYYDRAIVRATLTTYHDNPWLKV